MNGSRPTRRTSGLDRWPGGESTIASLFSITCSPRVTTRQPTPTPTDIPSVATNSSHVISVPTAPSVWARKDHRAKNPTSQAPGLGTRIHLSNLKMNAPMNADGGANMNDLPVECLKAIASCLPKTTRGLLAVALTAPSSSWQRNGLPTEPSEAGRAILSTVTPSDPPPSLLDSLIADNARYVEQRLPVKDQGKISYCHYSLVDYDANFRTGLMKQLQKYYNGQWEILDFVDLEKSVAARLSDADVAALLKCIDATNSLRHLILTHCLNVVGDGLHPLRSSKVLKTVDARLVRQFEECQSVDTKLSEEPVLTFLSDVLGVEGNSFKNIHIPSAWCLRNGCNNARFTRLLRSHNLPRHNAVLASLEGHRCREDLEFCARCDGVICAYECNMEMRLECSSCHATHCYNCNEAFLKAGSEDYINCCEQCDDKFCMKCRFKAFRDQRENGHDYQRECFSCDSHCLGAFSPKLLEMYDEQRTEIESLRAEVKRLKKRNWSTWFG